MQRCKRLAYLRNPAPQRDAPFADKGLASRFVLGPEYPSQQYYEAKQRHCNEELSFHVPRATPAVSTVVIISR
jgi:hypothetical protein